MPEVSFDRCYVCKYPFTGLPAEHRCPECGEWHSAATRLWRPARRSIRRSLLWTMVIATAILCEPVIHAWIALKQHLAAGGGIPAGVLFNVLLFSIAVPLMLVFEYRQIRIGRFAAITPDGVIWRGGLMMTLRRAAWREIGAAKVDSGVAYLTAPGKRGPRRGVDAFARDHADAKAFASAVNETAARFRPSADAIERHGEQA